MIIFDFHKMKEWVTKVQVAPAIGLLIKRVAPSGIDARNLWKIYHRQERVRRKDHEDKIKRSKILL